MGDIIGATFLVLASAVSTVALLVLLIFLIPGRVQRAQQAMQNMPGRSFLIGLGNAIFFLVLATIFAQGGDAGGLIALIIILVLVALATIGLSALVLLLRDRIYPESRKITDGMRDTVKAATLLVLAGLFPFVGWFVFAPILLLIGLGASIIVLFRRDRRTSVPDIPPA